MAKKPSNELLDTLKLSDEQWQALIDSLGQGLSNYTGQRRHIRTQFRKLSQIAVAIKQSDGQWVKYLVRMRDLSRSGLGFIHGAYVHVGNDCRVILKDATDQLVCIDGTIRRCNLVQGRVHNIGVQFKEEIDIKRFLTPGQADKQADRDAG